MDIYEIQKLMREKSKAIGEYSAKAPQTEADLRSSLFGSDQTLGSLRENEADKIKELYNHDKTIASNYQPPEGFLEDPGAKAQFGSDVIARQGGELADIQKGIANRRDVLGDALDRGMKIFMAGLDALNSEYSGLKDQGNFAMQLKEMAERAEERKQAKADKNRATERVNIGGQEVLIDSNTGETIKVLGASGTSSSEDEIDAYAASYLDGKTFVNEIPAEIRGKVLQRAAELKQQAEEDAGKETEQESQPTSEGGFDLSKMIGTPGIPVDKWLVKLLGGG